MVDFVDVLVKWAIVHALVREVVPDILHDEEEDDLTGYGLPVGEGNLPCTDAKVFS